MILILKTVFKILTLFEDSSLSEDIFSLSQLLLIELIRISHVSSIDLNYLFIF